MGNKAKASQAAAAGLASPPSLSGGYGGEKKALP
jgi:hypothetical protein